MSFRLATLAALVVAVGTLSAGDKKMDKEKIMAAMAKHAEPGEAHRVLELMAGKFDYTGTCWMDPESPMPMRGKSEGKVIMNGRFCTEKCDSSDPSMPFEGKGWWGYDNQKKKYVCTWIDSFSTSIMTGEGAYDKSKRTLTWEGECFCPVMGQNVVMKGVIEFRTDGSIQKTFYMREDGKETKAMEINCVKSK